MKTAPWRKFYKTEIEGTYVWTQQLLKDKKDYDPNPQRKHSSAGTVRPEI